MNFNTELLEYWKVSPCSVQDMARASFEWMTVSRWRGMEAMWPVDLLRGSGSPVALTAAAHLHRCLLVLRLFWCLQSIRLSGTKRSLKQAVVLLAVSFVPSPAGKLNQHLWSLSAERSTKWYDVFWDSGLDKHQQKICLPKSSLTVETELWTSSSSDSVPLHSSSSLWDLQFQVGCTICFSNSPILVCPLSWWDTHDIYGSGVSHHKERCHLGPVVQMQYGCGFM